MEDRKPTFAILVAISAIAFITGNASVPLLCVNGFIFGVLNALWYPAFSGLMPMIVPGPLLQAANSILGFGANVGFTLGASVAGLIVAICGDIVHSRVARSNIHLLNAMGARVRVIGPPTLMPAAIDRMGVEVFHDMRAGLKDCDIVIEAITENLEDKRALYAEVEKVVGAHTILASNTSSLCITELGAATNQSPHCSGALAH